MWLGSQSATVPFLSDLILVCDPEGVVPCRYDPHVAPSVLTGLGIVDIAPAFVVKDAEGIGPRVGRLKGQAWEKSE
jgi:hypothetical protein